MRLENQGHLEVFQLVERPQNKEPKGRFLRPPKRPNFVIFQNEDGNLAPGTSGCQATTIRYDK